MFGLKFEENVSDCCGKPEDGTFYECIFLFIYLRKYFSGPGSHPTHLFLWGNLENQSVQCLISMKAAPYLFIVSHHLALYMPVEFKLVSRQGKSIQVKVE